MQKYKNTKNHTKMQNGAQTLRVRREETVNRGSGKNLHCGWLPHTTTSQTTNLLPSLCAEYRDTSTHYTCEKEYLAFL